MIKLPTGLLDTVKCDKLPLEKLKLGDTIIHRGDLYIMTDSNGDYDASEHSPAVNLVTGVTEYLDAGATDYELVDIHVLKVSFK